MIRLLVLFVGIVGGSGMGGLGCVTVCLGPFSANPTLTQNEPEQ